MVRYKRVPSGENSLFSLLKTKDISSFTYLYDTYSPALYGVILKIIPDRQIADEVLIEVFINIWKKLESYDPSKRRFFTWMLNIARNTAIGKVTKKSSYN